MPANRKTILIPGGNGFLGIHVSRYFLAKQWRVIVLSRSGTSKVQGVETLRWDGETIGEWTRAIESADVVLNLAGRNVNCRYTARNRKEILDSRVKSTRILGQEIAHASHKPSVWLNSSTATIYRHAEDRPQDEITGEIGTGFSVNIAKAWEEAFFNAPRTDVRRITLRSAMVMGRGHGGPFSVFQTLARFGLGGRMGSGRQMISWIHIEDFCRAVEFLIEHNDLEGSFNLTAPLAASNADFMRELRRLVGMPIGIPSPGWLLEIGAFIIRTETELPLKSRWAIPTRLERAGFEFKFPDCRSAIADLLRSDRGTN